MKVQTLKRSRESCTRLSPGDLRRENRNLNPHNHPMQRAREYTRAVTAAKLDRMFAKPLIAKSNLSHNDAVTCSSVSRHNLLPLLSGSADGVVKLWDLATRTEMANITNAHGKSVTGVVFGNNSTDSDSGGYFYSCSEDGKLHQWSLHGNLAGPDGTTSHAPLNTWRVDSPFKSIDHHWQDDAFATASNNAVQIWTSTRNTPLQTHSDLWGSADSATVVRYHPSERALLANCSADRGVGLHDTRTANALKKTVLRMRSNDLQWNPLEPMTFAVANEDFNAYTFDMRRLDKPVRMYKGHVATVLSLSWSPTGREFATGSYDKTLRIFSTHADSERNGTARDIYHHRRMQRIWTVQYTRDDQFIVTGSDDTNLRLWKAQASAKIGSKLSRREEASIQYRQTLIKKYQHLPQVQRINRSRKIPSNIRKEAEIIRIQKEAETRKQTNRIKHAGKNSKKEFESAKGKVVVKEIE